MSVAAGEDAGPPGSKRRSEEASGDADEPPEDPNGAESAEMVDDGPVAHNGAGNDDDHKSPSDSPEPAFAAALSQGPPLPDGPVTYNVYVQDVPPSCSDDDLLRAFSFCGSIASAAVIRDKTSGASRGYGFVNFYTEEAREMCLKRQREVLVNGLPIKVYRSDQKATVYVSNVPAHLNSEQLKQELEAVVGPIHSIVLKAGYCFANFRTSNEADLACKLLTGAVIGGQLLKAQMALSKEKRKDKQKVVLSASPVLAAADPTRPRTLFVKNIDRTINQEELRLVFAAIGPVEKCSLVVDGVGASRGFGFVQYLDHQHAALALVSLSGCVLGSLPLIIQYSRAPMGLPRRKPAATNPSEVDFRRGSYHIAASYAYADAVLPGTEASAGYVRPRLDVAVGEGDRYGPRRGREYSRPTPY